MVDVLLLHNYNRHIISEVTTGIRYFEYVDPVFHGWDGIRVSPSQYVIAVTKTVVEQLLMSLYVLLKFLHTNTHQSLVLHNDHTMLTPCITYLPNFSCTAYVNNLQKYHQLKILFLGQSVVKQPQDIRKRCFPISS